MHQTFYIDIDEEITSIVDRLRKSKTKENIFVVPKRALILQSVVNLKVLKKEAEKFRKQIMVVTQDEQGRAIAEKIGILSQNSMKGIEEGDELKIEIHPKVKNIQKSNSADKEKKKKILENIGSDSFYSEAEAPISSEDYPEKKVLLDEERPEISKEASGSAGKILIKLRKKERGVMSDILSSLSKPSVSLERDMSVEKNETKKKEDMLAHDEYEKKLDPRKEQEIDEFYHYNGGNKYAKEEEQITVSGKIRKILVLFGIISLIAVLLVGLFLFLPKAKVIIKLSSRIQSANLEIKGDSKISNMDAERKTIPARIIEKEEEKTSSFRASGKNEISDQKARGVVAVYNEYSVSPQPLVATTRFATSDGKIFRLTKGIVVPGMTNAGGKLNPGVIEAEVVADEPGEEFNIGPSDFSIPGFQGSVKFSKFYGRSNSAMTGGGSKGGKISVISGSDIDFARKETEKNLKNEIMGEIKNELKNGEVISEDAIEAIVDGSYSPEAGAMADNFDFKLRMKFKAIVFSEEDLESVVENAFKKESGEKIYQTKIEYGKLTPEFNEKTINIKIQGKALLEQELDTALIKPDLLGKKEEELGDLLQKYPQIKRLEVEFWPEFLPGKIPNYGKRVEIEIIHAGFE